MHNEIIIKEHTVIQDFLINKELNIVDLGACLGEFSLSIDKEFNLNKSILVEANPTNFLSIKNQDNFILINKAVDSQKNKTVSFSEDTSSPYNGSVIFDYFKNSSIIHELKTITLEEIIDLFNIKKDIDILKIDIEGSEYNLLENASNSELLKFKQITVEFHDFIEPSFKEKNIKIHKKMEAIGFKTINKSLNYKHGSEYYDTLFYKN